MLNILLFIIAAITLAFMFHPRLTKSETWQATLTPLSSIIGSGFLVIAPLLASVVGNNSPIAVTGIVILAYAIGSVIRFNILHAEPFLHNKKGHPVIYEVELFSNITLSLAYITAVAFYLSLLSTFLLHYAGYSEQAVVEKSITTIIIIFIAVTGYRKGLGGLEKLEAYSMSLQLSIVVALLVGLSVYDFGFMQSEKTLNFDYQDRDWLTQACILGGILLVVQGFETSRFLGSRYSAAVRIKTMKRAQIISGALYVIAVIALLPIVQHINLHHIQVADIVEATGIAATALPLMLIVAAVMSQFSAAVADTVGAGCLVTQNSAGRLTNNSCYFAVSACAIFLVWTANLLEIISFASRAFALYYFLQCVVALFVSYHHHDHKWRHLHRAYFSFIGSILILIVLFAIPAE